MAQGRREALSNQVRPVRLDYVDDILCVWHNPDAVGSLYEIKNGDASEPTRCLGARIKKSETPNGDCV